MTSTVDEGALPLTDAERDAPRRVTAEQGASPTSELAAWRTGMAFQRTRLSAERTLMSVIRTALSLISFGFTIYQVFAKMHAAHVLGSAAPARNFGLALLVLGVLMLIGGIGYHLKFLHDLRHERSDLRKEHRIHGVRGFPVSMTLLTALLLLVIGVLATVSIVSKAGPFQ